MTWLARSVDRLDRVQVTWLLALNALFCLWVLLAQGGTQLVVHLGKIPTGTWHERLAYTYFTTIPPVAVLLLALVAWVNRPSRGWVLKVHAFLFLCVALWVFLVA